MVPFFVIFPVVAFALFLGLQLLERRSSDAALIRKRIADGISKSARHVSEHILFRNPERLRIADDASSAKQQRDAPSLGPSSPGLYHRLDVMLQHARLPLTGRQFVAGSLSLALLLGGVGILWGGILLGPVGFLAGLALPLQLARMRMQARQLAFLKQLPGAFELMARVLRSGSSVTQAIQCVIESYEDPIAKEFASCQQQQNFGLRPEVTYHDMARRSGILELHIFVMAMLIQHECGGNLSEVLDRLAVLVRNRLRLAQQVRALTAEGRLQGSTLLVLPFVIFGVLYVINRDYAKVLLDHQPLLAATLGFMLVGVLWIRKIVAFDP